MSGGKNTKPSPINVSGSRSIDKDTSLVSTEKAHRAFLGYTIIEVMIVLAVSGVMFVIASSFISGKQEKTVFVTGTNEFAARLQNTIEEVTDGQYSDIPFDCDASDANLQFKPPAVPPSTDCIFLGKFYQFGGASDQTKYAVFSLAAARDNDGHLDATAKVTPITATFAGGDADLDLTDNEIVPDSLTINDITVKFNDSAGVPQTRTAYGIGFVQGLGMQLNGVYQTGAQTVSMVYAPNLGLADLDDTDTIAHDLTSLATINSASLCISDGQRYALIELGTGGAGQLSVNVNAAVDSC